MNSKVFLIGLAGKARSGKDTSAGIIKEWAADYNFGFAQEAFARRLKESAAAALGVNGEEVTTEDQIEFCNLLKESGSVIHVANDEGTGYTITGREFLQYYGTEAHRDVFANDFWVDAVLPRGYDASGTTPLWHSSFQTHGKTADIAVITDVRFDNEAQRIREFGGVVWELEREGAGAGNHASEAKMPWELVDLTIINNGTIEELEEKVEIAVEALTGLEAAMLAPADGVVWEAE